MGGTMRLTKITLAAVVALGSASFAETTAPGNIKFGENGGIELSLTSVAGDAASGRKIFMNRKQGNCLACHVNSEMSEQTFHGMVGPVLDGIGAKFDRKYLLESIVNPSATIAKGYDFFLITLKNGQGYAGIIKNETNKEVTINYEMLDAANKLHLHGNGIISSISENLSLENKTSILFSAVILKLITIVHGHLS